jgi:hypothetical protein
VAQKHLKAIWLASESSWNLLVFEPDAQENKVMLDGPPRVLAEIESSEADYAKLAGVFDISKSERLKKGSNLACLSSAEPSQSATSCASYYV